jgi:LmbE family N-acetylglucosaminyl deacetylase/glycosyltransferase involved in cell wall biosynthesis
MDENELIPYSASEITAERVLTLSAHPDDDVLGAGGLLAALAASAEAIRAVVVTGGEAQESRAGGSGDPETRRREAREAADALGIRDVVFWEFPDRGLAGKKGALGDRLRSEIAGFRPDLVLAPSPCEIHPDHRALAEAVYDLVATSRAVDADHDAFRMIRLAFYEVTQPILPNALVPLGQREERKRQAISKFVSQAAVRDYAGAIGGLNAFRGLTLDGAGPAESFRVIAARDASRRSLAELRREIGPSAVAPGERSVAPVAVVVRTRNRPALLAEALESLSGQTSRPRSVVIVNDGGAPVDTVASRFASDYGITRVDHPKAAGRSRAANAGAERVAEEALAFLDDDDVFMPDHFERLLAARASGPEPMAYSDAVTVLLDPAEGGWKERHRELQYSLDYDAEYLLYANYIPLHTVLFDTALLRRAGGFDAALDYSEDWDLLIRLSFETPFRHVRGVTAAYRVFAGEGGHVEAGGNAFQQARDRIFDRYRDRRSDAMTARVLDRLARRLWEVSGREYRAEGELAFQRASHRRLASELAARSRELEARSTERDALNGEAVALRAERERLDADRIRLEGELKTGAQAWERTSGSLRGEIARLQSILQAMEGTKAWRLHLWAHRLKGNH